MTNSIAAFVANQIEALKPLTDEEETNRVNAAVYTSDETLVSPGIASIADKTFQAWPPENHSAEALLKDQVFVLRLTTSDKLHRIRNFRRCEGMTHLHFDVVE